MVTGRELDGNSGQDSKKGRFCVGESILGLVDTQFPQIAYSRGAHMAQTVMVAEQREAANHKEESGQVCV